MKVSDKDTIHSFANQTLLDGVTKLGYKSKVVPRNNGGHANHSCGFCYLGCKFGIKQGSDSCWLKDASQNGCQFMDQVHVEKILHEKGKAYGIICKNLRNGNMFTIKGPKKFIVSGGSLHTPVLLQKSGFQNKNIGSNLQLHPTALLLGDFGKNFNTKPYESSILTSVVNETEDLDGKYHGSRIETIMHAPYMEVALMKWNSSDETRKSLLKYNNYTAMVTLIRDTSTGNVTYDKAKPEALIVDYSMNAYVCHATLQAILCGSDILYIQGALEILTPQYGVPNFKSDKPKDERAIDDKDYVEWRKMASSTPLDNATMICGSAHQMGSCRISGKGPSYGAADTNGRLFECENIYIADASAMPTACGVNPMVTIMSIARKIALNISKELSQN